MSDFTSLSKDSFLGQMVLFGALFSSIISIGYFLRPNKKLNFLSGILYASLSIPQWSMVCVSYDVFKLFPQLSFIFPPFYTLIGPLAFVFFTQILNHKPQWERKYLIYFLPFPVTAIFMFYFSRKSVISHSDHFDLDLVMIAIFFYTFYFLLLVLLKFGKLLITSGGRIPKIYLFTLLIVLLSLIDLGFFVWFQIVKSNISFVLSFVNLNLITVTIYWGSQIFPNYMSTFRTEVEKQSYTKSKLGGVNLNEKIKELNRLMEEEHLYADEDLTLTRLAESLDLHPHQLSELLNHHLKYSFKSFLNGHRINAACRFLKEDPNRTILSIMEAVGFTSKSSFHVEFLRKTGTTPTLYRKNSL